MKKYSLLFFVSLLFLGCNKYGKSNAVEYSDLVGSWKDVQSPLQEILIIKEDRIDLELLLKEYSWNVKAAKIKDTNGQIITIGLTLKERISMGIFRVGDVYLEIERGTTVDTIEFFGLKFVRI